jgi:hypothetical protein
MALGADYKVGKKSKVFAYYSVIGKESGSSEADDATLGLGFEHSFSM